MICKLCFGTGSLFAFRGSPQFWPCPACGATGAQAWRPIETAPTNGTYIIVAKPGMPAWEARMGRRGWYCLRFGFSKAHSPTHWMPLPAPPTQHRDMGPGFTHHEGPDCPCMGGDRE